MLNNRDEKYQGSEESEYHFSDEEVSYEVEPEAAKPAAAAPTAPKSRLEFLNRLSQSRRMLISFAVFLVLIFIVYKMVTPSSTTAPSTQITPAVVAQNEQKEMQPTKPESNLPKAPPVSTPAYTQQMPTTPPSAMQPTSPAIPTAPAIASNLPEIPQGPIANPQQTMPTMPANMNVPRTVQQQAPIAQQQPMVAQQTTMQQQPMMQQPSVMQVQPAMPTQIPNQNMPPQAPMQIQPSMQPQMASQVPTSMSAQPTGVSTLATQVPGGIDAQLASLASQNQQLMSQLRADYTQKITDFSAQTKTLQDQVVALNTRVASMEKEINQLVQTLTRQSPAASSRSIRSQSSAAPAPAPAPAPEMHIPYNVQAIIPGRAWLRSDNGETVTVAEGDVIKDLGRVTKIDPYDGIVEINTGSRMISLSYGTGG